MGRGLTGAAAGGVDHQRVQGSLQVLDVPPAGLLLLQEGVGGGHLLVLREGRLGQACGRGEVRGGERRREEARGAGGGERRREEVRGGKRRPLNPVNGSHGSLDDVRWTFFYIQR